MTTTRGLLMGGGGFKATATIEHVHRLKRDKALHWDHYGGLSAGGLLATLIPMVGVEGAMDLWYDLANKKNGFRGGSTLDKILTVLGQRPGFYDMAPLRRSILDVLLRYPNWVEPDATFAVTVTDLVYPSQRVFRFTQADARRDPDTVAQVVWQSCLVPLVHNVHLNRFADGGVWATAPLDALIQRDRQPLCDEIDVILLSPLDLGAKRPQNALEVAGRAIELLQWRLLVSDLFLADRINQAPDASRGERTLHIMGSTTASPLGDWMDDGPRAQSQRKNAVWLRSDLHTTVGRLRNILKTWEHASQHG